MRARWEELSGFEPDYWLQAAALGWTSSLVPTELGGGAVSGRPVQDGTIVAEELGRAVAPGPFLPTNIVAGAIARSGSAEQQQRWLPGLLEGSLTAAWALAEPGGRWKGTLPSIELHIEQRGRELVLTGEKAYIEAAAEADLFLVVGRLEGSLCHLLVPRDSSGLQVVAGRSIDLTRRFGRLRFDAVRLDASALLGEVDADGAALELDLQTALALQCAETVGAADRAFWTTLDYGRDRFAFGRPVVSFQAIKHRLADMLQWLEFSKAVTEALAREVDDRGLEAPRLASVAKAYVADRCLDVIDECVQLSGGIGVTWEHHVHLYSRRVAVNRAVLGTPEQHKARLAVLLEADWPGM